MSLKVGYYTIVIQENVVSKNDNSTMGRRER